MKKIVSMVVALALAAGASVAQAADNAWFTLQSGGPGVSLISQGPGQALIIEKGPGPGTTNLTIGYNITSEQGGMGGYAIALNATATADQQVTFSNPQNVGAGYTAPFPGPIGQGLVYGAGAPAGNGGTGLVLTFNLSILKPASSPGEVLVLGQFGPTEQAYGNGSLWFGSVGPNPPDYGSAAFYGTWGDLPVIVIRNIPEPASIALLGLGALALIRRRK